MRQGGSPLPKKNGNPPPPLPIFPEQGPPPPPISTRGGGTPPWFQGRDLWFAWSPRRNHSFSGPYQMRGGPPVLNKRRGSPSRGFWIRHAPLPPSSFFGGGPPALSGQILVNLSDPRSQYNESTVKTDGRNERYTRDGRSISCVSKRPADNTFLPLISRRERGHRFIPCNPRGPADGPAPPPPGAGRP